VQAEHHSDTRVDDLGVDAILVLSGESLFGIPSTRFEIVPLQLEVLDVFRFATRCVDHAERYRHREIGHNETRAEALVNDEGWAHVVELRVDLVVTPFRFADVAIGGDNLLLSKGPCRGRIVGAVIAHENLQGRKSAKSRN